MTKFKPGHIVKVIRQCYDSFPAGSVLEITELDGLLVFAKHVGTYGSRRHQDAYAFYAEELRRVRKRPMKAASVGAEPVSLRERTPTVKLEVPREIVEQFGGAYDAEGRLKEGRSRPMAPVLGALSACFQEGLDSDDVKAARALLESSGFKVTRS